MTALSQSVLDALEIWRAVFTVGIYAACCLITFYGALDARRLS